MKILSISSGRADVGILTPVWRALASRANVELHTMLTGAHVSDDYAARHALPPGAIGHTTGADIGGRNGAEASEAMAHITEAAGHLAARIRPDRALLVGDRLDMLPAAVGLLPLNVPLVHLHGGELTFGAADDRARHAITKLSHLHCTSTAEAAERIARMGEESWRIRVTGAPGLDSLLEAPLMGCDTLAEALGVKTIEGLRLVTVHPETNAADPLAALSATLGALEATPGPSLITAPNADPGGIEACSRIDTFVARHGRAVFRATLGSTLYANVLRHAAVMVGNSSSGLIEAGLFGLPVINVGGRQDGRQRGANVRDCAAEIVAVERLLRSLPDRYSPDSPYGDGRSATRVADAVLAPYEEEHLLYKRFSSNMPAFTAPWDSTPFERRKHA